VAWQHRRVGESLCTSLTRAQALQQALAADRDHLRLVNHTLNDVAH
jgi:hypothetical protein